MSDNISSTGQNGLAKATSSLDSTPDFSNEERLKRMEEQMKNMLTSINQLCLDKEEQKVEVVALKKDQEEANAKLKKFEDELAAFKNFENLYRQIGGETVFYMDIEKIRDMMLEDIGDNQEMRLQLDDWYERKKKQRKKRIGVAFVGGALVGETFAGLACAVHAPLIAAATGGALLSSGGILAIGLVGAVVLVGIGLGVYKLYRMYKVEQIQSSREIKKLESSKTSHPENDEVKIGIACESLES